MRRGWIALGLAVAGLLLNGGAHRSAAQQIRGVVLDQENGNPVPMAGVYLLARDRDVVSAALADIQGRYVLDVPRSGEYILRVQRLGYFETESPLVEVSGDRVYEVDLSVRPEPIRIEGLEVEVDAESQNQWARDRLLYMDPGRSAVAPAAGFGFRLITGARLEEAKLRAHDALDLLRWVYVPIFNSVAGTCVQMRPDFDRRGGMRALSADRDVPAPVPTCGKVYLDGQPLEPEFVEGLDFRDFHAVMVMPPELHIMTGDFERRFRQTVRRHP